MKAPSNSSALPFCAGAVQSILDPADPLAYAQLQGSMTPALLQVNLDDGLLPNCASFALDAALHAAECSWIRSPPLDPAEVREEIRAEPVAVGIEWGGIAAVSSTAMGLGPS